MCPKLPRQPPHPPQPQQNAAQEASASNQENRPNNVLSERTLPRTTVDAPVPSRIACLTNQVRTNSTNSIQAPQNSSTSNEQRPNNSPTVNQQRPNQEPDRPNTTSTSTVNPFLPHRSVAVGNDRGFYVPPENTSRPSRSETVFNSSEDNNSRRINIFTNSVEITGR